MNPWGLNPNDERALLRIFEKGPADTEEAFAALAATCGAEELLHLVLLVVYAYVTPFGGRVRLIPATQEQLKDLADKLAKETRVYLPERCCGDAQLFFQFDKHVDRTHLEPNRTARGRFPGIAPDDFSILEVFGGPFGPFWQPNFDFPVLPDELLRLASQARHDREATYLEAIPRNRMDCVLHSLVS